jgi:hypothetical protein
VTYKPAKYKPYSFRFGGIWIPGRTDVLTMMRYVQKSFFNGNKNKGILCNIVLIPTVPSRYLLNFLSKYLLNGPNGLNVRGIIRKSSMRAFEWYATPYIGIWVSFVRQTDDGQSEGVRFVFSWLIYVTLAGFLLSALDHQ